MDPIIVLSSIQDAIYITKAMVAGLKAVRETDKALSTLDLQEKVVEIREQLVNAKDLIITLLQENQKLRDQLQLANELEHDEDSNILWRIVEGKKTGPFCSTCYGDQNKLISLSGGDLGSWHCPKCKNHFSTKSCRKEQHRKCRQAFSAYKNF